MATAAESRPLNPDSIREAYSLIKQYIHKTPLLTNRTLDKIISTPSSPGAPPPKIRLFLKCENFQKIGAFKARGAHHALIRVIDELGLEEVKRRGVVTHSSGNHAQALALAARTFGVPSYIVMPKISTPSKIKGTQAYSDNVLFSGSTSQEREAAVQEVVADTGAILIPPYDHEDIMLGQGTTALEMHEQFQEQQGEEENLDLVISPLGGGGLLSGICVYFSQTPQTRVFGSEPSYQGCDDGKRGLEANPPTRITTVKSLTIADGLRTPVGARPWKIFTSGSSNKAKHLEGIRNVTEEQIKDAMRLLLERVKLVVEPSSCVPLAALLYDEEFRSWIAEQQKGDDRPWNVGIVLTGGNTTIEAIVGMFGTPASETKTAERHEGKLGADGQRVAENVAG